MTAAALAQRLDARSLSRDKWIARCPAHDDRRPSLAIADGRDGRVLLRCWAGCELDAILGACSLRLTDLFADSGESKKVDAQIAESRRAFRKAPRATVEAMLTREVQRQRISRLEHDPDDADLVRGRDHNAARRRVNQILGTKLKPVQDFWWETCPPHDRDPLWPLCLQRAAAELRWTNLPSLERPPRVDIEDRAAEILHEFARSDAATGAISAAA